MPASYVDIADALEQYGNPDTLVADLHQLFRRVVFKGVGEKGCPPAGGRDAQRCL
jgi:hypothetical protein